MRETAREKLANTTDREAGKRDEEKKLFDDEVEVAAGGEIMHVKRGFNGQIWNPPETCSSAFACCWRLWCGQLERERELGRGTENLRARTKIRLWPPACLLAGSCA